MVIVIAMVAMIYRLTPMIAARDTLYETFEPLLEVDALIQKNYVTKAASGGAVNGAIRGMLLDLDPYSGYIAPEDLDDFLRRHRGEYVGAGIEIGIVKDHVTVIAPIAGSPADRAGIKMGDGLVAVNGQNTKGRSIAQVETWLTGPAGSVVSVGVSRGDGPMRTKTIRREEIKQENVTGVRRDSAREWEFRLPSVPNVAYVRVRHFSGGVATDFRAVLRRVTDSGLSNLVIDLRGNPGGDFHEALTMADLFVDSGVLVSTVSRRKAINTYLATSPDTDSSTRLVVLIDEGSASSAEIVAGTLQYHRRATVVGQRSFGKGSVQNLFLIQDESAGLKLTVAHYQFPDGRVIHKTRHNAETDEWGVIPDVVVEMTDEQSRALDACRRRVVSIAGSPLCMSLDPQLRRAVSLLSNPAGSG
jgi:carboxyl-terminal processing protease